MATPLPPTILADWDEEKGPCIIDSIFPREEGEIDDSPEVLVTRCYISAQSIFARVEFSKITFSIPMVSLKKLAIVFFDVVPDTGVRGGKRPFILVVFMPIETKHGLIDEIAGHVEPFLEEYKGGTAPDLSRLQQQVISAVDTGLAAPGPTPATEPAATVAPPAPARSPASGRPEVAPIRVVTRSTAPRGEGAPAAGKGPAGLDARAWLAQVQSKGIRVGPWKNEELAALAALVKEGKNEQDIAGLLHRTLKDVQQKLHG